MVRNQFYILIIGIIIIILFGYMYQVSIFSKEIYQYFSYYSNLVRFYYTKIFLEKYQIFFYIDNSVVFPVEVFYNCSLDNISLSNSLNLQNILVFDRKFNYLPTSSDNFYINFTILEKEIYRENLCIFRGYLVQNNKFSTFSTIKGHAPYDYKIQIDRKIKINKEKFIKILNNIIKDFSVDFDGYCTELKYFNPEIYTKINSLSLEKLNLYYMGNYSNIITIGLENLGNCPVDIRKFFYETDKPYKLFPGYNANATSFIINPGKVEIFNFSNFYGNFCLHSTGFKKCISSENILILIDPSYFETWCLHIGQIYSEVFTVTVYVNEKIQNPVNITCLTEKCVFSPNILSPGLNNNIRIFVEYNCPGDEMFLPIYSKAIDMVTGNTYDTNVVLIRIERLGLD